MVSVGAWINGALGVVTVVLILLTYKWRRMDTPAELGSKLVQTIEGEVYPYSDYEIVVEDVKVREPRTLGAKVSRLALRSKGHVTLTLRIRGPGISQGPPWGHPQFQKYAEDHGVDASYEMKENEPPPVAKVTIQSFDERAIRQFVRDLPDLLKASFSS